MPFQIPGPTNAGYKFPAHRVYLAPTWADEWTLIPGLWCNWCLEGCGTEIGRAELVWQYGRYIYPGSSVWADHGVVDLIDHWAMVEIDQVDAQGQPADPIQWTGLVTEIGDALRGGASGSQTLICHGPEILLERTYLDRSWYDQDGLDVAVPRAIQFNAEHDYLDPTKTPGERKTTRFGNRAAEPGQTTAYTFSSDLATAKFWSTYDILIYLLAYHMPRSTTGIETLPWSVTDRARALAPQWDRPVIAADGKTVRHLLSDLFDRRRLLSWRVVIEEGVFKIDVFSFNHAQLALPGGGIQAANADVAALSFGNAVDVASATLQSSAVHRVDRVICRGARKRAAFTVSKADATLEADWKSADETAYEAGPTGIGSLDQYQKQLRVKNWRREGLADPPPMPRSLVLSKRKSM